MIAKDLGMATAYAYAVSQGYTGTEAQFAELMASYATVGQQAVNAALAAAQSAQDAASARDTAQTTVNGAIAGIQAEGQTQVGAVQAEGTTQVGNVNTAGTTQVGAVQAKGTEVLNSIPADYTELSDDVTGLKSAVRHITDYVNLFDKDNPTTAELFINTNGSFSLASDNRLVYVPVHAGNYVVKCGGSSTKRIAWSEYAPERHGHCTVLKTDLVGAIEEIVASPSDGYISLQLFIDTDSDKTPSNYFNSIEIYNADGECALDTKAREAVEDLDEKIDAELNNLGDKLDISVGNISGNAVEITGLYISDQGVLTALTSGAQRLICIEAEANKTYRIDKKIASSMRVGCGSSASLPAGTTLSSVSMHTTASDEALYVDTTTTDYYIYIHLFSNSDSVQSISEYMKTLIVDVSNEKEIEQIKKTLGFIVEEVDFESATVTQYYIAVSTGLWNYGNNNEGYLIPLTKNHKMIYFEANNTRNCIYALLKNDTITAYTMPDYAGNTTRTVVPYGTEAFVEIPSDANYVWVYKKSSAGYDFTPSHMYLLNDYGSEEASKDTAFFHSENLKGLPILNSFSDITVITSAFNNSANFHALAKETLCDVSNGYITRELLGDDGHDNDLYVYKTNPASVIYGANRNDGSPVIPPTGGKTGKMFTVLLTTNIHGREHNGNWVVYNLLLKILAGEDSELIRFFKNRVKLIWIPYICASGNYENADGVNINRDFPIVPDGECVSNEAEYIKSIIDEYGSTLDLHIDIHTFQSTAAYAPSLAGWTFTDSDKLGERGVVTSKSVLAKYAEKYPDISRFTLLYFGAVNKPTTCTYYTQTVYGVPAGTIEGVNEMSGSPSGSDEHTSAVAYLYDMVLQTVCSMVD